MTGIRTVSDLLDRCHVDEDTGCWHWRGGRDGSGAPVMWVPVLRKRTTLGALIGLLRIGEGPTPGVVWHRNCATKCCANPQHRRAGTRRTQMLAAGLKHSTLTRARMSVGRRVKLDDTSIADIRSSIEPLRVVAARHGVSITTCSRIRRMEQHRPAGVSVFSAWGR